NFVGTATFDSSSGKVKRSSVQA
ncbi:unnamed protein product, partial [Adineta steineri]